MTNSPATDTQLVHNKLVNRRPVCCPVCDRYIACFRGIPVILDSASQIIQYVHPACCVKE